MPELGAVLESPVEEVVEEQVEQVEGAEEGAVAEETAEAIPVGDKHTAEDWRTVPKELKEFFKSEGGRLARDAWFERKAWNEKFAGGTKEADELLNFMNERGGMESLAATLGDLQTKAQQFDGMMAKIAEGNREVIADIPPESMAKLAPAVAEQWAQADPEGWGAAMSGIMAATIQQNGIPMFLERMSLALEYGKTEDVGKMLTQLKGWSDSFSQKAAAPRTQAAQPTNKLDVREQSLNEREARIFGEDLQRNVDAVRSTVVNKELEPFIKRAPGDADKKELAIRNVMSEVDKRVQGDKKLVESISALIKNRDKDGALKLIKNREDAIIKEIAPRIGRLIYGNPTVAKVEPVVPAKKATPSMVPARAVDKFDAIFSR